MAGVTRRSNHNNQKKVYHLSYNEMKDLCSILDKDGCWKKLCDKSLKLNVTEVRMIEANAARKNESPTEELIRRMGSHDYSVEQLFVCLHLIKSFGAMTIIKSHDGSTMLRYIPFYSYNKLKEATCNWTREEVGRGGFGVVLKSEFGGMDCAFKVLKLPKQGDGESCEIETQMRRRLVKELRYSNKCRHDNILPLYGYSICEQEKIYVLIYQFMAQGSLYSFLYEEGGEFDWQDKVDIAKGIACGLRFLHSTLNPPVVHADIKSANILLDQNFFPKIGDFGLARQLPEGCSYLLEDSYRGTREYSPPEFRYPKSSKETFQGEFSTKIDVYAFGVVLFELITSIKPSQLDKIIVSSNHECNGIRKDLRIQDSPMNAIDQDYCELLLSTAEICVQPDRKTRPEMVQIFQKLMKKRDPHLSRSYHVPNTTASSELAEPFLSSVSDDDVKLAYYNSENDGTTSNSSTDRSKYAYS